MKKKVTINDIALSLNVSTSTVSRVLNKSNLISDKRSKEIIDKAKELGYQNRNIKKHKTRAILNIFLFLPETDNITTHFFYNMSELMSSIQKGFGEVKLNFITRINDGDINFFHTKKNAHIDGAVFAFTRPKKTLQTKLKSQNIPYILLNRIDSKSNYITYDIRDGLISIVDNLIKSRGKSIKPCFVGLKELEVISLERFKILQDLFSKRDINISDDSFFMIKHLDQKKDHSYKEILSGKYNAIIALNDLVAIAVLQRGISMNIKIPEDISLVGFDNSPIQNLMNRRIDTVNLATSSMGEHAGIWLKNWIINREEKPISMTIPIGYIKGETV